MDQEVDEMPLPLLQGVIRWGDQALVAKIIELERPFSFVELEADGWPQISVEKDRDVRDDGMRGERRSWRASRGTYWLALERDLRARLNSEQLYLEGVPVTQDMDSAAQAIRGALASEFHFDFRQNTLRFKQEKFVSVTLSPYPSSWAPLEVRPLSRTRADAAFAVEDLTTDQIAELIEEHGRRVIRDPEAKLMPPGKVSLIPLIQMKMQDRARRGELNSALVREAAWLAAWIAEKAEHWDIPKPKTIARSLGATYAALRARSNGAT